MPRLTLILTALTVFASTPIQKVLAAPAPAKSAQTDANLNPASSESNWIAAADWAKLNHLKPPVRIMTGTNPVFEMKSDYGKFSYQVGSRAAHFNGVMVKLGFAPKAFGGQVYLHQLDYEKNLEPLLFWDPQQDESGQTIVVDPGHGGGNTGTRSMDGALEKDYTLDWGLRLKPLLESAGWTVFLTRTNDLELTLPERVAFADFVKADLFISLHFNASGGGNHQAGLETYCTTPQGMPSNLIRDGEDDSGTFLPNNAFDVSNIQLAFRIHQALLDGTEEEDRGIQHARFMGVLRWQKRPAILIEGGYLSNPEEAARIEDPEFRQQLAEAVASGIGKPSTERNH